MPRITAELDMDAKSFFQGFDRAKSKSRSSATEMEGHWRGMGGMMSGIGKNLAGEVQGLLAIGGLAGAAAGMKQIVDSFGDIHDKSAALNETPETIQRVSQVASEAGGSLDGMANAILKLEKNLGDVENSKARAALEKYGITAQQLMSLPLDEKIAWLADAFQQARRDGTGLADLQALLGKGSTELIPLLSQTGDELRRAFSGVDVLTNDAVARLDTIGDKLSRLGHNANVWGGQVIDSIVGLFRAADSALDDLIAGKEIGTTFADKLSAEEYDAVKVDRDRKERAASLQAAQEEAAAAKQAEDAAKRQREADEKAARDKEASLKRIETLNKQISRASIDALPDADKVPALKTALQDVFDEMKTKGGLFFDGSIEGLSQWAAAAQKSGNYDTAETALKLMQEALAVSREIEQVTEKLKKDGDDAAKKLADALDDLRKNTGKNALDLLPAKERIAEFRRQLEDAIGSAIKGKGDIAAGLSNLQKQADEARARGDGEGEKAALEKLQTAQEAAKNMAGVETAPRQHVIGSLGGAVNRILGRDPTELVAEEGRKTNQTLDRIERLMTQVERNTRQNQNQPVGATFL